MPTVTDRLPDVAHADAGLVVISPWHAGGPRQQHEVADEALARWTRTSPPQGLVSLNVFASLDGEALLAYSQWTSDEAHSAHTRTAARGPWTWSTRSATGCSAA